MTKRMSSAAIVALKDALSSVYWYKSDLRSFLQNCITARPLIAQLNWENYKRQVVADLVDTLCGDQDQYLGDLTRLCHEVSSIESFTHLEQLDGGEQKVARARTAVEHLRKLMKTHSQTSDEEAAIVERQKRTAELLKANQAVREKLEDIKKRYMQLVISTDPQGRGYDLEALMYDLFELFDLDPKASFKNTGEQIDGAFALEGTEYLFEAKWQKDLVSIQALDAFSSKVQRKLDNTLGVFLAINQYSTDAVQAHSTGRPNIILMDGADLIAVLEERIDFITLLLRKKRHAAQTGSIYFQIHQILA